MFAPPVSDVIKSFLPWNGPKISNRRADMFAPPISDVVKSPFCPGTAQKYQRGF